MLLLATVLPLLAFVSAAHNPPHLRHRRLAHEIQQKEDVSGAKVVRDNAGHAEAHRIIKRTVVKRGQTCRPKKQKAQAALTDSAVSSPSTTIDTQNALAQHTTKSTSSSSVWHAPTTAPAAPPAPSPPTPPPAPSPPAPKPQPGGNNGATLNVNDPKCGWCNANGDTPNGSQDWLNCGVNAGGWTPPFVTVDQLITKELNPHGAFAACAPYFDLFYKYGAQQNIPPIMLAAFAMQESTCNPKARGGAGEVGLMQITPANCHSEYDACFDLNHNVMRGAELFRQMINDHGGNVIAALGAYNGWQPGLTVWSATKAKNEGKCSQQNNLDYITQWVNGWILDKVGYTIGTYFNLKGC